MTDASLFAIGGGVTFLFLAGAYRVLRSRFLEAYGSTNVPKAETVTDADEGHVVPITRARAAR